MSLDEEKEVIMQCKESLSAFTQIYDAYIDDVFRYVYSRLYNRENAEDITSEVFMIALEKINTFEHNGVVSVKSWLFSISRNLVLNKYKKKEMEQFDEDYSTTFNDENILETVINKDLLNKIEEFMTNFHENVREIIQLCVWEEMSFGEIATVVNKKETAVKMAYYRALEKINNEFNTTEKE